MRTCDKVTRQMGLKNWDLEFFFYPVMLESSDPCTYCGWWFSRNYGVLFGRRQLWQKNMGYSKSIYNKVKHTHTLINVCQLWHLCTQKSLDKSIQVCKTWGGLDEKWSFILLWLDEIIHGSANEWLNGCTYLLVVNDLTKATEGCCFLKTADRKRNKNRFFFPYTF